MDQCDTNSTNASAQRIRNACNESSVVQNPAHGKASLSFIILTSALAMLPCANASLRPEDRGSTTYDPNTGLEWLDLSFTAGRSYQEVIDGWGGYTTTSGYRMATRSEVMGLFTAFGENRLNQQANVDAANRALSSLGTTLPMPFSNFYRSWMLYDAATENNPSTEHVPTAVFGTGELGGGIDGVQGFFLVPGLFPTFDYRSPEISSALVRQVPEPAVAALAVLGLAIVTAKRRQ